MNMHEGGPVIARQRVGTANLPLGILQSARYSLTRQPFHPRALESANHPRRHATSQKRNEKKFQLPANNTKHYIYAALCSECLLTHCEREGRRT